MSEFSNNAQWAAENEGLFIEADEYVLDIGRQNATYEEVQKIADPTVQEFANAAVNHLRERQHRSFMYAKEAAELVPYDKLAIREMELATEIEQIRTDIIAIKLTAEAEVIAHANKFKELIPEIGQKIDHLAESAKRRLASEQESGKIARLQELEAERRALNDIYDIVGREWQIPTLLTPEERAGKDIDEVIQRYTVDQFPAQKGSPTPSQIGEILKRRIPEEILHDASEFLALLLAEVPNTPFTTEQLAEIIYNNNIKEDVHKVSALISNFETGKVNVINRALTEHGLVMQRGKRITLNALTHDKIGPSKVIFRATHRDKQPEDKIYALLDQGLTVEDSTWRNIEAKKIVPAPAHQKRLFKLANDGIVAKPKVEEVIFPDEIDDNIENDLEKRANSTDQDKPKWLAELEASVSDAIRKFEADGIMLEGDIRRAFVKIQTSSGTLATDESLQRAAAKKIIPPVKESTLHDRTLSFGVHIYLCMAIQNSYPAIFESKSKRPVALAKIREMAEAHFQEKKLRESQSSN